MIVSGTELSRQTALILDLVEKERKLCLVMRRNKPAVVMIPFHPSELDGLEWETLDEILQTTEAEDGQRQQD